MLKTKRKIIFFLLIELISSIIIANQESPAEKTKLLNPIFADKPPVINGVLDDSVWKNEPTIYESLITKYPTYGEVLPYETKVWIAYDPDNIYIAFHCYDNEPSKLKTSITKRDNIWRDDHIGIALDTTNNKQNSYEFYINPNGIQGDLYISGANEDESPDWVWYSSAKTVEDGYTGEIHLPLKNFRYSSGENVQMGIIVVRYISRLGLEGTWPEVPAGKGFLDCTADLMFKQLNSREKIEILPAVTYSSLWDRESPERWSDADDKADFGVNFKYGLGSSVTLEATINPDFSQIESDEFQVLVNQRFPIFYSEKRPFFMEASNIFTMVGGGNNMITEVHTRKIIDPTWGLRLTGELGKSTFGFLAAGDEWPGRKWDEEEGVNPYENKNADFYIGRFKYSLGGDNYIGALYSGREFSGQYNRVIGADLRFLFAENHDISANYMYSFSNDPLSEGETEGGELTFSYNYTSKPLSFGMSVENYDKDFKMDTAHYNRTGFTSIYSFINPKFYPDPEKIEWLKRISATVNATYLYDKVTEMKDLYIQPLLRFDFLKQGFFCMCYNFKDESWMGETFKQRYGQICTGAQLTNWLNLFVSVGTGSYIYYDLVDPFLGDGLNFTIDTTIQPDDKLSLDLSYYFQYLDRPSDGERVYDVNILNFKTTYQFNQYLFVRAILRYDNYEDILLTDLLASFTLIPGTVIHIGYGSLHEKLEWQNNDWIRGTSAAEYYQSRQSLFFKASYVLQL